MKNNIAPIRYYSKTVKLTWCQTLKRFLKYRSWSRRVIEYEAVYIGDPRYESAPYEQSIIFGCNWLP